MLICFTSAFSQVQSGNSFCVNILIKSLEKENTAFKKSFSVNLSPSLFVPINLDNEKRVGYGAQLGIQWNYKVETSLCLDFDLAYTVIPGYSYSYSRYTYNIPSIRKTYMMLTAGIKYYFPLNEKLKFFCTPGLGAISMKKENKEPETFPCLSFEVGTQYKLNNNFSTFCKLKISPQIKFGILGGNTDIGGVALCNIGLSYQF